MATPPSMSSHDLFEGLPPPAAAPSGGGDRAASPAPPPPAAPVPKPALKSSLKRTKPSSSTAADATPAPSAGDAAPAVAAEEHHVPEKRLRFRTTVDASETQIIEAMQKITSHIGNRSKFSKASKLALQLIEAGSVKPGTVSHFFAILEASMSSPGACNDPSVRADYHTLFGAAQGVTELFNQQQKNQFDIWVLHAVVANDLFTDDSFVFSKAVGKIKDAISALPMATADDDNDEAAALATASKTSTPENKTNDNVPTAASHSLTGDITHAEVSDSREEESSDPFGLDDLLDHKPKKSEKAREKTVAALNRKADEEESKRFLKSRREALLKCLEIAARRYRLPWTQTTIDIFAKHAYDNVNRFTKHQRDAIEMLWNSIKEQQIRRKQGKSVNGKLDVNAFEHLQEKYAREKISIRHAVGGGGRRATQWLG
ncbi:hypothetical protein QOZ80_2BG0206210 [Eleusine coracana subsp. coracana]|nr:hypothetical protein QOZ80_2BG0206210 [Eleusine coracana subsp. coracana]